MFFGSRIQILRTVDGLPIRINIYHGERRPTITANCAIVKSVNHPIENGSMLHVTDAILPQITKSIADILLESKDFGTFTDCEHRSSLFNRLVARINYILDYKLPPTPSHYFLPFVSVAANADLMDKLSEPGNYTVFAFTDSAFNKIDEELKTKLMKGKSCMKSKCWRWFKNFYCRTYLVTCRGQEGYSRGKIVDRLRFKIKCIFHLRLEHKWETFLS